ncbi:MAG: YggS family pyridoxal phosphate-dependent enzyme [Anaeromicrobium sp.]|jgi:pyridoxal phosphate enzyme (YggS family)|uniref:YggS family pyridoxal phosphate-dependent enzyme n=1 Tax=Anaeromicrobium sp. TaxID=1929132 RepID=UPI0025EEEC76|nr:YggS family pyridoxal phosphate-dependent enzyme [Anaeromicrobium sp.]MCT4592900.1 YggS family pyridoxal phosphate-dependent enzyme [Anaeromicrobium sp.]
MSIKENIEHIRREIKEVCNRVNREYDEVTLIGVTKTIDCERIRQALDDKIDHVGENKVQEIMNKYEEIKDAKIHMIGHLQTNKVKYIIDKVSLIHSLDRLSLAKEINKRAKQHGIIMDTLVQVNVANEDTKFGLKVEEVERFLEEIRDMENIRVLGLMTIAPYEEDSENVRIYFKELKNIFEELKNKDYSNVHMKYLSMGMTNDYKVAIEEGTNFVRIGTGIFGERNYYK